MEEKGEEAADKVGEWQPRAFLNFLGCTVDSERVWINGTFMYPCIGIVVSQGAIRHLWSIET
jgi:hypothetical protein